MEKDTFESRISKLVNKYEPQPPEGHWESIQSHLRPPPAQSFSANPLALSFSVLTMLVMGALFYYYGVPKAPGPDVFDNYWVALQVARDQHKPMLVLFTQDCEDCDAVERALHVPQIADLADEFVQVQLRIDDPSRIDTATASRPFQNWDAALLQEIDPMPCPPGMITDQGDVWKLLQDYLIGEAASPVLAVIDPQNRATPFAWYDKVSDSKKLSIALHTFLKQELDYFKRDLQQGKRMFANLCGACHNRNMKDDMTGPALGGTRHRWRDYPTEDLYNYIRNSQKMVAEGHPRAVALDDEWHGVMTPNPNLSDQEMDQLLDYVEWEYRRQNEY